MHQHALSGLSLLGNNFTLHQNCFLMAYFSDSATSILPTKNLRERKNPDLPLLEIHAVVREEGEGMETTDTESVSSASTYVPSLEQLLNSPDAKFGKESFPNGPHGDCEHLVYI